MRHADVTPSRFLPSRDWPSERRSDRRSLARVIAAVAVVTSVVVGGGCAHAPGPTTSAASPARASVIPGATPVAITTIDAPGLNVDDLTARLRLAFESASGVPVVDEVSMRGEIAACLELPCPTTLQDRFRDADKIVHVTISKVGPSYLGSLRVMSGLRELVRVNGGGADAGVVVDTLGRDGGAALHTILTTPVPTSEAMTPESNER